MSGAERRDCPRCGHLIPFLERESVVCTECGAEVDWTREAGREAERRRVPPATGWVVAAGLIGMPILLATLGMPVVSGGPTTWFRIVFPYAWILGRAAGEWGIVIGVLLGALQGPAYGFLLGLHLPLRSHIRLWAWVLGLHAVAASVALFL